MIKRENKSVKLEFGTGDICVAGGYTETKGQRIGLVIFINQEPREIGSPGIIKAGEVNLDDYQDDYHVIMTFSKKESIDAIIRKLEEVKSFME